MLVNWKINYVIFSFLFFFENLRVSYLQCRVVSKIDCPGSQKRCISFLCHLTYWIITLFYCIYSSNANIPDYLSPCLSVCLCLVDSLPSYLLFMQIRTISIPGALHPPKPTFPNSRFSEYLSSISDFIFPSRETFFSRLRYWTNPPPHCTPTPFDSPCNSAFAYFLFSLSFSISFPLFAISLFSLPPYHPHHQFCYSLKVFHLLIQALNLRFWKTFLLPTAGKSKILSLNPQKKLI